ncbi:LuxR C-terminal-related transcriptional regulator [Maribellus maritimus]|uniref:LuxR C-terminal-related transcriptional regulator n=1 Tax=Maribellus maritimus TaxID=2870838 RepID=UPI001EEBF930|nr:LuxR C-terminal-related transcriptional regulator [Maribellus maritimus]MCG6186459.1 LuxR C-terminal-related transcriptional regulator [Maribellus maritimus]
MDKLKQSIKNHAQLFSNIKIQPEDINYDEANQKYIPFLQLIDSLQTSIVVASDFYKRDYYFVSDNFNSVFGFQKNRLPVTGNEWFRRRFHPDDYIINEGSIWALKYFYEQPVEKRKDFRLIHEFRIKNDNDKWIRLIIQNDILELDKKGNMWIDLKLCDFSPNQDLHTPGQFIFKDKFSDEIIYSLQGKSSEADKISPREKQVLELISEGHKSAQIAEKLFISVNTVNNHRRNMIEKLNVSNTSEAVRMAAKLGVI